MVAIHDSDSGGGYEIRRSYGEGAYGKYVYGYHAYIIIYLTDSGTGSEAQFRYSAGPVDSDSGTGSEALILNVSSSDSGTGADYTSPVFTYGSGSYGGAGTYGFAGSVIEFAAYNSGTGSETRSSLAGSVPIADVDSGTGSETQSPPVSNGLFFYDSEYATGIENYFVITTVVVISDFDSGTGSDAGFTPTPFARDSGAGIDAGNICLSGSDSGTGTDVSQQTVASVPGSDSGTGTDVGQPVVVVSFDSGTGFDSGSKQSATPSVSDSAIGTDASLSVGVSAVDSGTGAEAGVLHLSGSDSGTGTDSQQFILVASSDLAGGTDSVSSLVTGLVRGVGDSDFGTGSENLAAGSGIALRSSDSGLLTDTQLVISGISIVQFNSVNSGAVLKTSQTITLPAGIGLGNLVVVSVGDGNNNSFTVITGPTTGPWRQAVVNNPAGPVETSIWYMVVSAAAAGQTSWTFTSSVPVSMALSISEFKSIYGWQANTVSGPLDQTAQGNVKTGVTTSSTADSGTTPQTAQIAELWVASHTYVGASPFTTTTPWTTLSSNLGSGVSLSQLSLNASSIGSADCSISMVSTTAVPPQFPQNWSGCAATFMPWIPVHVSGQDSGRGYDSAPFGSGTLSLPYITVPGAVVSVGVSSSDSDSATGSEPVSTAGEAAFLVKSDSDFGTGWDGSPDIYGTGLYNAGFYNPGAYISTVYLAPDGDYATGTDALRRLYGAPGPALSAAAMRNIFEGFSLSRVSVLASTGAESAQLYGAQAISLVPNVTSTAMKEDDWDSGVWYTMDKATLTVTNGFMSWATISSLTGVPVSSFGTSPNDYYGLPLWTQQQHNLPSVPMAIRMSARNASASVRTLDFLLYKVQLAVADFTGMVYKQGLGVSYAGTVLFSSADEQGNILPYPQIGRFVSSPGTRTGAFTQSAYA